MVLVPLFDLKFLHEFAAGVVGTFKSAALARGFCARRYQTTLRHRMWIGNPPPDPCSMGACAMTETKERTYSDEEINTRLKRDLPHWYFENGWIRRKYRTHSWKGTLMVINTV